MTATQKPAPSPDDLFVIVALSHCHDEEGLPIHKLEFPGCYIHNNTVSYTGFYDSAAEALRFTRKELENPLSVVIRNPMGRSPADYKIPFYYAAQRYTVRAVRLEDAVEQERIFRERHEALVKSRGSRWIVHTDRIAEEAACAVSLDPNTSEVEIIPVPAYADVLTKQAKACLQVAAKEADTPYADYVNIRPELRNLITPCLCREDEFDGLTIYGAWVKICGLNHFRASHRLFEKESQEIKIIDLSTALMLAIDAEGTSDAANPDGTLDYRKIPQLLKGNR